MGFSSWLFGGFKRLGELEAKTFTPAELQVLRNSQTTQIIDARITLTGFGHDYFFSSPAVSSDLILLMRYHLTPAAGKWPKRSLRITKSGFWSVDDSYPEPAKGIAAPTTDKTASDK